MAMIKTITPAGRYTQVQGSQGSMPYISPGSQSAGMMRLNTSTQNVEVYDGAGWQQIPNDYVQVGLTPEAESLLDWARDEKYRQLKREGMIRDNPALQKAYEAIKRAEENFDILSKFVENDNV